MMFRLTGNLAIMAPGGVFNNFTAAVVTESGTPYWAQRSLDGQRMNVGYCLTATGNCAALGAPYNGFQYLAAAGGGQLFNITFAAQGPVTITLLGEIAGLASRNTLGWYHTSQPGVLYQLFPGSATTGAIATFTPSGTFALYSTNGMGQFYSSISAFNIHDSGTHQHFAFFHHSAEVIPEPATLLLSGVGLSVAGLYGRRKLHRR
jgi:hypothetical protein